MKKILLSLGVIAIVAAISISATGAFFSDTETSTANVFTAGAIDLKIDSEQHYNNAICVDGKWKLTDEEAGETNPQYPIIGSACGGTWGQDGDGLDIVGEKFFSFDDIKPGDFGENTISLHVINNDAWLCAAVTNLSSDDNGLTEPEAKVDTTDGVGNGELDNEMVWKVWRDDANGNGAVPGDNIWQDGEQILAQGNPTDGVLALYDSMTNTGPLTGATTGYMGVSWQLPASSGNETQTDSLTGDISFYTVQSRNNGAFKCSDWQQSQQPEIVWTNEGTRSGGDASFVEDESRGNVLQLVTVDDVDSRVRWVNDSLNLDLSTFTGISYDSKQVSAFDAVNGNASMRLIIDEDGNTLTLGDTVEITYEPYYNIAAHNPLNGASILGNTWQTWDTTPANGKFWANGGFLGSTPSGGAYATNFTLAQVLAAYPSSKIVGISFGMGTYNKLQTVLVDNLMINGSPYSLEN